MFPAKALLFFLSICYQSMENYLLKTKRSQTHLVFKALEIWLVKYYYHQRAACRLTGDVCLVIPAKALLYKILICYKRPQTHLLMSFSSIRNMNFLIFLLPKINMWSDW